MIALALLFSTSSSAAQSRLDDLHIVNGRVIDGSGAAWFYGDVAVAGGKIVAVVNRGALSGRSARDTVDASGLVVAPGFIDIQGHSGWSMLYGDSRIISKVSQGVTTEILGEGSTPAPLHPRRSMPRNADALTRRFAEPHGFANWLDALQARGTAINVGSFVGGSTIRQYGMGLRAGRATPEAMADMQGALARAMEDGAFGIATALIYPPGVFASTDELIELVGAMRPYGGLYITHLRSEGDYLLEALDEAIRIGREGGVPVEIYHLKAGGRRNWEKGPESVARIDAARASGLDIQANMYPYPAGHTGLTSCLPPAAQEDGRLYERLYSDFARRMIRAEIENPTSAWENLCVLAGAEGTIISRLNVDSLRRFSGMRLSAIADSMNVDWIEAAMRLVLAERNRVETIYFLMSEENIAMNLTMPWMKVGTDAGGVNPANSGSLVHPRAYGTFTRILGFYSRDMGMLSLEDAVRKMTSATARRVGIPDRGLVAPGMWADIVLFDPRTVGDRATFSQPHQVSTGIHTTFVNGVAVWRNGAATGARPGRALRGPAARNPAP